MKRLSVKELVPMLDRLEEVVDSEGGLMVTHEGRDIARILPPAFQKELHSLRDLRDSLPRLDVSSEMMVREDRDSR